MSKNPEKPSKKSETPTMQPDAIAADCRRFVIQAGGSRQWSDTRESWLARAAHHLGIPHRRAKALFYREVQNIPAHEYLTLKARCENLRGNIQDTKEAIDATACALAALDREDTESGGGLVRKDSAKDRR